MTPKQLLQSDKALTTFWLDLAANPAFIRGLDSAALQLAHEQNPTDDPVVAANRYQQAIGAREYKRILLNIAVAGKEPVSRITDNLRQPQ